MESNRGSFPETETISAFMQWVEERVPKNGNEEFLSILENKLSGLDENNAQHFMNSIKEGMLTDKQLTAHHHTNQTKWNIYSLSIINDLAVSLQKENKKKNLMEIIRDLGKERHYIAIDLGHGSSSDRNQYGLLRGIETPATEICFEKIGKEKTAFSYMFDSISESTNKLISDGFLQEKPIYQVDRDKVAVNILAAFDDYHTVLTTKNLPCSSEDMCVMARKNKESDKIDMIAITYPAILQNSIENKIEKVQPLFEKLMELNPHDDINLFMRKLGELSYHLYRILPLRRGTASIVDWLIRGIAESKQLELGHRKTNDLPQDFQAFLTKSPDEYANWFAQNAFVAVKLQEKLAHPSTIEAKASTMGFFSSPASSMLVEKLSGLEKKAQGINKIMNKVERELGIELQGRLFENASWGEGVSFETKREQLQNEFKDQITNLQKKLETSSIEDVEKLIKLVEDYEDVLPLVRELSSGPQIKLGSGQ